MARINTTSQSTAPNSLENIPILQPGFPEFWATAYQQKPDFFAASRSLQNTVNTLITRPVKGKKSYLQLLFAMQAANSFGAVVTLASHGYGYDALRIARSMFEVSVNSSYLRKHPEEVENSLTSWVSRSASSSSDYP